MYIENYKTSLKKVKKALIKQKDIHNHRLENHITNHSTNNTTQTDVQIQCNCYHNPSWLFAEIKKLIVMFIYSMHMQGSTHRKGIQRRQSLKKGKVEEYICLISNLLQSSVTKTMQ